MSVKRNFEFRAVQKDDRAEYDSVVNYVFGNNSAEPDPEHDVIQNDWTTAAFHKGKVVATSAGYPFKMRLNGKAVFVDGLTDVGTVPGFRRRGLVRELVTRRLNMVHEHEQQSASILWASMAAIYQRFGYGLGSTHSSCSIDPRYAMFQFETNPDGYVKNVEEEEGLPIIKNLYRTFINSRTLDLHRADIMWKGHFGTKKRKDYCAVYYDSDDQPQGYITYRLGMFKRREDDPGPDQRIQVHDYVYHTMDAYRGLWEFMRAHDLVGKIAVDMPRDDPALDLMLEPRMLNLHTWDALWLRIVDVDTFIKGRNYGSKGTVVLEILEDPECPWNVGKFLIDTDGETTEVNQTTLSADVTIGPNGLASLLTGNSSMTHLVRIGRATASDPTRLPELDTLFKTSYLPFCRNGF